MSKRPENPRSRSQEAKRPRSADERSIRCLSRYENEARERGFRCIAGIDEVGRGALFGPVFAAAVVLDPEAQHPGLTRQQDSGCGQRAEPFR